jgi:hypothetical protein
MARIRLRLLRFGPMIEGITGEDALTMTAARTPHQCGGVDQAPHGSISSFVELAQPAFPSRQYMSPFELFRKCSIST